LYIYTDIIGQEKLIIAKGKPFVLVGGPPTMLQLGGLLQKHFLIKQL